MIGELVGNYQVVEKLGEGGMGAVFMAVHQQIGRRAVVKVLHAHLAQDPEIATRFLNEARAVNIVQHPGMVSIFEFGQLRDGAPYIIMEYLGGETLRARLNGGITESEAVHVARQLASALAAAHESGIVHRDLKPENVMITADPEMPGGERVKVLDFGIAKFAARENAVGVRTATGMIIGTPLYMAPEQCRGAGSVDDKADVYSLGAMLYEMLSGRPPFIAQGAGAVLAMHLYEAPPPLHSLAPLVRPALAALVHRLLAKAPAERPPMTMVAQELLGLGAGAEGRPVPSIAAAGSAGGVPHSTLGLSAGQVAGARVHPWRIPGLALGLCGIFLLGVMGWHRRPGETPHAGSVSPAVPGAAASLAPPPVGQVAPPDLGDPHPAPASPRPARRPVVHKLRTPEKVPEVSDDHDARVKILD